MNLTVNACQAMENNEEGNVRRVIIKTSDDGERFIVEVSDTGTGIKDNILHKIFDPFFTTKPDGQGTGLGLSISHGIIRRHHGDLTVSSELGIGSLFKIVLPIAK
jgi:signal transduction histidine kinase